MDFYMVLTIIFLSVYGVPQKEGLDRVPVGVSYSYDIPFDSQDSCKEFMETDKDSKEQVQAILAEMDKSHGKDKYSYTLECVQQGKPNFKPDPDPRPRTGPGSK